jgi:prefoldin subunit 5
MTQAMKKLVEDLHRVAEALAEFQRELDRVEANIALVEATNNSVSNGHVPARNGHLQ